MPTNIGLQEVILIYHQRADSSAVNKRYINVRKTGIYSGGYLTIVSEAGKTARLSALVCEISDGTHQVKITTDDTVTITVAPATPYFVLRWTYTGSEVNDYMDFLAVASPAANDLVVAKCTFTGGGNLQGFDYSERSTPAIQDLFLKVEPTEETELRVRVRAGRIQTGSGYIQVVDQKTSLFTPPASNSKIYLVYINTTTGAVAIDSSGTAAASPVAPDYLGKLVLAEVTLTSISTNITSSMIRDVRNFITPVAEILTDHYLSTYNSSTQQVANGAFTRADLGTIKKQNNISVANNQITLTANRKYALSYAVTGEPTSISIGDPTIQACWVIVSGDTSWSLEHASNSIAECAAASRVHTQISSTCYIKPSVTTVIELQVYTENTAQKAQIKFVKTNIMSID